MRLVDDDRVIASQVWVRLCLSQQHTVRHQFDLHTGVGPILEADLVTHPSASGWRQGAVELLCDSASHRGGSQSPGLSVPNQASRLASTTGQGDFGQLSGLAGTRLPTDHNHRMPRQGLGDGLPLLRDRQGRIEAYSQQAGLIFEGFWTEGLAMGHLKIIMG